MNATLLRLLAFALAGAAQAASIAWPWSGHPLWWLQLLSLAGLVWLLEGLRLDAAPKPWRRGFGLGWAFATAWLCGNFWWLFISMHTYGGMAAPLAALAVLALAAALGLYYAVACSVFVGWGPRHWLCRAVSFSALWTVAELIRGYWFTGFPWGAGGYAHVEGPLAMLAPLVGVYGIVAIAALAAAMMAQCLRLDYRGKGSWLAPAGVVLMLGGLGTLGVTDVTAGAAKAPPPPLQIALLQGNIPQDEKFIPGGGIATALDWYGMQLRDASASLVVTPETALPLLPSQLPPGYLPAIASRYGSGSQAAIVGLPMGDGRGYTNTVLGFKVGQAEPYRYDKHHLVPFGEFVPGMFRWFTDMLSIPLGDFARGGLAQPSFEWLGQRIAPNICYEDLFGEEIGANFRDEALAPTILLNVSNIAWFGDSVAIDEHLAISRMRALEFQRPMVRATNTGTTAVIDHHGVVTQSLPRLTRGVLVATVEGRNGITPYAAWVSRFGLVPLWLAAMLVIAITVLPGVLRRRPLRGPSR
ncbi:apolipoprotein N-acyltransferase [Variovorax sp. dw_308]|uniref:apolipoprotein N-acyltransferase n=1 Tax=Variovorax sp. dw_308 TaxID=2721546 RepID=UPI001C47B27B|nr:apolipoprotein N-acyltransferase [Variovorax sp. dw_308]